MTRLKLIKRPGDDVELELDMDKLYDDAWAAVDPKVKKLMVTAIRDRLDEETTELIRDHIAKFGPHDWIHKDPFDHFFFGMQVRNALRADGILDADLPPLDAYYGEGTDVRNLDDYYVQAMVEAVND